MRLYAAGLGAGRWRSSVAVAGVLLMSDTGVEWVAVAKAAARLGVHERQVRRVAGQLPDGIAPVCRVRRLLGFSCLPNEDYG